jgi:hypothetical protein
MEAMRQSWSDDRLDGLNEKVDLRFDRVERDQREFRLEMKEFRVEMKELRVEMNERFDSIQRTMLQIGGVVVAALLGIIATQL